MPTSKGATMVRASFHIRLPRTLTSLQIWGGTQTRTAVIRTEEQPPRLLPS